MRNQPLRNELAVVTNAGDIEVIDLMTGELVVNNRSVDTTTAHEYAFNYDKAVLICQKVKEGMTLNQIALEPWAPPIHIISQWQRMDRMFAEEMKLARISRADAHHEKMLDIAGKALNGEYSKDEVPGIKMGLDTLKFSIERANPERFGAKITHEGNAEKPILMRVINTGINRTPRQEIVEVDHKEIDHGDQEADTGPIREDNTRPSAGASSTSGDGRGKLSSDRRAIATGITRSDPERGKAGADSSEEGTSGEED